MDNGKGTNSDEEKPKPSTGWFRWSAARKVVRIAIGVILILLGLAALVTPFTPGSWLALVGLEFLGLRILLRDKLCAWAAAKPGSKFRRTMCRVLRLDGLDAVKRRWRERRSRKRP
jgi:hypothetical protein